MEEREVGFAVPSHPLEYMIFSSLRLLWRAEVSGRTIRGTDEALRSSPEGEAWAIPLALRANHLSARSTAAKGRLSQVRRNLGVRYSDERVLVPAAPSVRRVELPFPRADDWLGFFIPSGSREARAFDSGT